MVEKHEMMIVQNFFVCSCIEILRPCLSGSHSAFDNDLDWGKQEDCTLQQNAQNISVSAHKS